MSDAKVLPLNLSSLSMEQLQKRLRELDESRRPVQVTMQVPADVYEILQGIAHCEGTSVSVIAANLVSAWLAQCVEKTVNPPAGPPE